MQIWGQKVVALFKSALFKVTSLNHDRFSFYHHGFLHNFYGVVSKISNFALFMIALYKGLLYNEDYALFIIIRPPKQSLDKSNCWGHQMYNF